MLDNQLTRVGTLRATHEGKQPAAIIQTKLLGRPDAGKFIAQMGESVEIICQFLLFADL